MLYVQFDDFIGGRQRGEWGKWRKRGRVVRSLRRGEREWFKWTTVGPGMIWSDRVDLPINSTV